MGRDTRSEAAQEYRRLYRTRRWRDVRADQLSRHPLCAMCLPRVTAATVVDHVIKDSKKTEEGFFAGPFQSLCKTHHDSTKQRETGFTNSAAPVAEGAAKPESDLQFDLVTTSAKVIAHWMKASKQILSDVSQLRSTIDQRLLYGLAYAEEQQLLNGSGSGQNLHGIIPQATAYAAPITIAGANPQRRPSWTLC